MPRKREPHVDTRDNKRDERRGGDPRHAFTATIIGRHGVPYPVRYVLLLNSCASGRQPVMSGLPRAMLSIIYQV